MAREKQKTSGKRPVAEWMVTFSDMVTLIMTFFVLLFSMSNLDVRKIEALAESYAGRPVIFSGGFGDTLTDLGPGIIETTGGPETIDMEDPIVETGDSAPSDNVDPAAAAAAAAFQAGRDQMQAMTNTFRTYVAENYGENVILIDVPPASDHMVINFGDDMLFDSGSADIKIESYAIIDGVLDKLLEYHGHRIRVEGHTDNVPQRRPPFTSNRQLSSMRAAVVVDYMEEKGFDPNLLSSEGMGEHHPVASNDTPEGRARNRRVEIKVYAIFEGPSQGQNAGIILIPWE